ncbi:MAG: hypothetical protein H7Y33_08460 [Cytophagales bacterium]|nr:hypothetical protein [Rhizobacter sp.]
MNKLILGALISLTGVVCVAHAAPTNTPDKSLLANISQAEYQALIYTASECGFEPSTKLAVTLLKSSAMPTITAAVAKHNEPAPALNGATCAALAKS